MEKRKYSVTPQDRMNYVLGLYSADQQINAVLYFPVGISKEILEESVRITLQLQPVLNSRFVEMIFLTGRNIHLTLTHLFAFCRRK